MNNADDDTDNHIDNKQELVDSRLGITETTVEQSDQQTHEADKTAAGYAESEATRTERYTGSKAGESGDYTVSEPLDAESSATSELAALLSVEQEINTADYQEEEIELAAEGEAKISWPVVLPALGLSLAVVVWGLGFPQHFAHSADIAFAWLLENLGWAFVLFGTIFVIYIFVIALSRFGRIRLGAVNEQPEFTTKSWVAMMFAAGMGIGLMFFGAAEPLAFYRGGIPSHQPHEVATSMAQTMFHWTLHPWSVYAILALAIAYSTYRVGRKQLISAAFTPLIGAQHANGVLGKVIDSLSIFVTIFGVACSLGVGTLQIRAGLASSGLVKNPGVGLIVGIISVLTLAFLISAMSGVGNGIRIISHGNMILAGLLAVFVFVLGPTVAQLDVLPTAVNTYIQNFFEMASRTGASADGTAGEWLSGWTLFYWVWWLSWSPFVGMFLARISRGRTIREFCLGVTLVPAGVSTIWFAIFGGTAIWMEQQGQSIYGEGTTEEQLFNLLHNLPGGYVMGIVAVVLLGMFFITSADSASTVMGSISQDGRVNATPWVSGIWGVVTALIGLTLLVSGGNEALSNIQNVTIVVASPFLVILIGLMFSTVKDLSNDVIYLDHKEQQEFAHKLAIERRIRRERAQRQQQRREMALHLRIPRKHSHK